MSYYDNDGDSSDVYTAIGALDSREAFVELLANGPAWKRDLQDELGVSRSTVYKAIRELEEEDMVERRSDGYVLSTVGKHLFERRRQFHTDAEGIYRAAPLLSELPEDADVPSELLIGADVVFAERYAPNRPVRAIEEAVFEARSLVGFSPVVLPQYVDLFHDELLAGELEADLLLERPVVDHLLNEYEAPFEEAIEADDLRVHTTFETLPYGLLLAKAPLRRVVLIVYAPSGDLRGVIVNDTPAALEWAKQEWEKSLDTSGSGRLTVS